MTTTSARSFPSTRPAARGWCLGAAGLLALALLTGCASTEVTDRQEYEGANLPRPGRIIVYDFAAAPADLPAWSQARSAYAQAAADVSAEELAAGRKLGADVAKELVAKIDKMGINAVRAAGQPDPQLDDIVLIGYFTSIDEGSGAERVLIGFGKGSASVAAHVEGYHMTESGLVKLGSGTVGSGGGGKSPGLVVPALGDDRHRQPDRPRRRRRGQGGGRDQRPHHRGRLRRSDCRRDRQGPRGQVQGAGLDLSPAPAGRGLSGSPATGPSPRAAQGAHRGRRRRGPPERGPAGRSRAPRPPPAARRA